VQILASSFKLLTKTENVFKLFYKVFFLFMANPFATGYIEPSAQNNYLKFDEEGSYLFRIITPKTEVVSYFRGFIENPAEGEPKKLILPNNGDGLYPSIPKGVKLKVFGTENPIKLVWAVKVFNIDIQKVQVWEVSQASIRKSLFAIGSGKLKNDWTKFDIQITKTGQKTETQYTLITGDTRELTNDELDIINSTPVDLSAIERGEDPFDVASKSKVVEQLNRDIELPEISDEELDQVQTQMPF